MANTINLKGSPIRKEAVTSVAVRPGLFVRAVPRTSKRAGSIALPAAGGLANGVIFENELEGKTIRDAYAINDNVLYGVWPKGGEVLGRVAAGVVNIPEGSPLAVEATGMLRVGVVGTDHIVGIAIQGINKAGGSPEAFIEVEIV